ncbi:MAG: hypothetical protein COB54_08770 [Alphaproteobacteria bacterium]|nr:MAG: hypothetical protein COB54_08770 [Alphaproteobacteria bacterium]
MNKKNNFDILAAVQNYYRGNAYIALALAVIWGLDVFSYFQGDTLRGILRVLDISLFVILAALFGKTILTSMTLKKHRTLLWDEPDDYLREVARQSYKLTCGVVFLFLATIYLSRYVPLFGNSFDPVLPIGVFSEIILSIMASVFGLSYLVLSRQENEDV